MQYEKEVFSLYQAKTGRRPVRAERLGGGYYADVYRMYTENGACPDVVKIYKTKGMMAQECASLAVLREHAIFPMPQVLWTQTAFFKTQARKARRAGYRQSARLAQYGQSVGVWRFGCKRIYPRLADLLL